MSSLTKVKSATIWVALVALTSLVPTVECVSRYRDVEGDFCRNRQPSECCEDRDDNCELVILGNSYCYCDELCLQGEGFENDCCPDYFEVCLGIKRNSSSSLAPPPPPPPPPPLPPLTTTSPPKYFPLVQPHPEPCKKNGDEIPNGESLMVNCNECRCLNGTVDCDEDACMVDEEVISTVNRSPRKYGWVAYRYKEFRVRKAKDGLLLKTGTFNPQDQSAELYPVHLNPDISKIPPSFDARKKTGWSGRVGKVDDQGWCGASWVFSTLGVAQDRLSILARGVGPIKLSAQHLLSCSHLGQTGCEGGYIDRAWNYFRANGIVKEECYEFQSKDGYVPSCIVNAKRNDYSKLNCQSKHRFKMEPAYRISSKEEDIQWEIMHNGPVQAFMTVHSDMFMYESGVYSYTGLKGKGLDTDSATHSVRIIGWGSVQRLGTQTLKYWLVANSWGTQWGEEGYFRIKRGTNECGIESFIIASRGKVADFFLRVRRHTRRY